MSHKTIATIAILMLLVFTATVLLYPRLFNPDDKSKSPMTVTPVIAPVAN